jgi:hypothetical protein
LSYYLCKHFIISSLNFIEEINSQKAVMLVTSLGFATAVHPNARHGAIFHVKRYKGMFQGEMSANTPAGDRCSYVNATPSIILTEDSSCKM